MEKKKREGGKSELQEGSKHKREIFGVPQTPWIQGTNCGRHVQDLIEKLTKVPCGEGVGAEMQSTLPSPVPGFWYTGMFPNRGSSFYYMHLEGILLPNGSVRRALP